MNLKYNDYEKYYEHTLIFQWTVFSSGSAFLDLINLLQALHVLN